MKKRFKVEKSKIRNMFDKKRELELGRGKLEKRR
jgi:hypothetical protein